MTFCPGFRATPRSASTGKGRTRRQLLLDFLVQAFGGPAVYQGLDMKAAHEGLNITESDWAVMERHAVAVLDKFGIQGREREEFLGAAASLKGDIVQGH